MDGIQPRPLSDVIVEKLTCPTDNPPKKRKKVSGVSQKLYKPCHESLEELNIIAALAPLIGNTCPQSGFLRIWPEEEQDTLLVHCKFGVVPKGSVLSYQQPPSPSKSLYDKSEISVPYFNFTCLSFPPTVLEEKQNFKFESLKITEEQSKTFELQTREQSFSKDWYRLRKFRLTALAARL